MNERESKYGSVSKRVERGLNDSGSEREEIDRVCVSVSRYGERESTYVSVCKRVERGLNESGSERER